MKITKSHYDFWCQKKVKPSWWPPQNNKKFIHGPVEVSIHRLIPTDSNNFDRDFVAHNIMVSIRQYHQKDLTDYLYQRVQRAGTVIRPKKVSSTCNKWLTRILYERRKSILAKTSEGDMPEDLAISLLASLDIMIVVLKKWKEVEQIRARKVEL